MLGLRRIAILGAVALLSACANGAIMGDQRPELAGFRLAHNIVLTENTVKGPLSRDGDLDEIRSTLRTEICRRFERYEGERLYHLAVNVDAYILAVPGVPLVASPRSALIIGVHVWDDALGRPLNEEREQFTVLENLSGSSVIGSGLTQSADEQLLVLSRNAALVIENWLAEHPEWFPTPEPDPAADVVADEDASEVEAAEEAAEPAQADPVEATQAPSDGRPETICPGNT